MKWKIGKSSVIKDRAKSVHFHIDGHRMRKVVSFPQGTGGKVTGIPTSVNTLRPFKFADVQTTGVDYLPVSNHSAILTLCSRVVQTKI